MTKKVERRHIREVDDKLDQALEDSFPASDPVAIIEPAPAEPGNREPAGETARIKNKD